MADQAVSLYAGKKLTLVQAADLVGMGRITFQKVFQEHGVH